MATTIIGGDLKLAADKAVCNSSEALLPTKAFAVSVDTDGMAFNDTMQVFVSGGAPEATEFNDSSNNYGTDNGGEHVWKSVELTSMSSRPSRYRKSGMSG